MEFRIILQLHRFFTDHRSSCRIFITNKIKTVQDLQEHIFRMFEINSSFYLLCNSFYLPALEDVRVLKEDDVVVAVPCEYRLPPNYGFASHSTAQKLSSPNETMEVEELDFEPKPKRKRKCERAETSRPILPRWTKKKKSKGSKVETNNPLMENSSTADNNQASIKKKKKKTDLEESSNSPEIKLQNGPISTKEPVEEREFTVSKFSTSKPNFSSDFRQMCRKDVKLMPISSAPKIVKSIRVYDVPCGLNLTKSAEKCGAEEIPNFSNAADTKHINLLTDAVIIENRLLAESMEHKSQVKYEKVIQEAPDTEKELTPTENKITEEEASATEKAKSFAKTHNSTLNGLVTSPKNEEAKSAAAVAPEQAKIDCSTLSTASVTAESTVCATDESLDSLAFTQPKRRRRRVRTRKKKQNPAELDSEVPSEPAQIRPLVTSAAPSLHIRFEEELNEIVELDEPVAAEVDYEKLCSVEILRQPLMKDMMPKRGDVVAFKVYRLSQSYTPEISNFIIAQVLHFSPEKKQIVLLKILVGGDQCREPDGKFSMEDCDKEDETEKEEELEFSWSELIEPRLMFP